LLTSFRRWDIAALRSLGGSPVSILFYVPDADAVFLRAVDAGAEGLMPVADQFDGESSWTIKDPFGHVWLLATRRENIFRR